MSVTVLIVLTVVLVWLYRRWRWVAAINVVKGTDNCFLGIIGDPAAIRNLLAKKGDFGPIQNVLPGITGMNMALQKPGLARLWLGPVPHYIVSDADHAEVVLSSNELITKGLQYRFTHNWLGTGLLTAAGDKWRKNRKMLTPSFHFKILEQFVPVMSRNGRILVDKLEKAADANDGVIADLSTFIILCALDVICETAMGERINAQSDPDGKYIRAVHAASDIIMERSLKPWYFSDFVFNMTSLGKQQRECLQVLHGFTDSVIKSRKARIESQPAAIDTSSNEEAGDESGTKMKEAFMDTLIREHLQNPENFTEENIREEVDTFMFEGHDTTAWGVIWATYLLGLNPDCQQRVQDEVDALFADKREDEDLTLDEMRTGLSYTEAVVKEAQRLYPSVPIFGRVASKDTQVCDTHVPAGTYFLIIPTLLHHDARYWPDPQRFKPDRFLSRERQHPYAFIPFSAGPRNCIGQKFAMLEEKALIAKIFRKFKVTSLDHRDVIVPSASLILKSSSPIRVRLQARQQSQSTHL